jgi:hypothetical protein
MRKILITLGWCISTLTLYLLLLGLDVAWNLLNWRPTLDALAVALIGGAAAGLGAMVFLGRISRDCWTATVGWIASLALMGAGVYAVRIEQLSPGLLGRDDPSPAWYRVGRLVVMSLPVLVGLWGWLSSRRRPPERV